MSNAINRNGFSPNPVKTVIDREVLVPDAIVTQHVIAAIEGDEDAMDRLFRLFNKTFYNSMRQRVGFKKSGRDK